LGRSPVSSSPPQRQAREQKGNVEKPSFSDDEVTNKTFCPWDERGVT
jgi:hypothetical protein